MNIDISMFHCTFIHSVKYVPIRFVFDLALGMLPVHAAVVACLMLQ